MSNRTAFITILACTIALSATRCSSINFEELDQLLSDPETMQSLAEIDWGNDFFGGGGFGGFDDSFFGNNFFQGFPDEGYGAISSEQAPEEERTPEPVHASDKERFLTNYEAKEGVLPFHHKRAAREFIGELIQEMETLQDHMTSFELGIAYKERLASLIPTLESAIEQAALVQSSSIYLATLYKPTFSGLRKSIVDDVASLKNAAANLKDIGSYQDSLEVPSLAQRRAQDTAMDDIASVVSHTIGGLSAQFEKVVSDDGTKKGIEGRKEKYKKQEEEAAQRAAKGYSDTSSSWGGDSSAWGNDWSSGSAADGWASPHAYNSWNGSSGYSSPSYGGGSGFGAPLSSNTSSFSDESKASDLGGVLLGSAQTPSNTVSAPNPDRTDKTTNAFFNNTPDRFERAVAKADSLLSKLQSRSAKAGNGKKKDATLHSLLAKPETLTGIAHLRSALQLAKEHEGEKASTKHQQRLEQVFKKYSKLIVALAKHAPPLFANLKDAIALVKNEKYSVAGSEKRIKKEKRQRNAVRNEIIALCQDVQGLEPYHTNLSQEAVLLESDALQKLESFISDKTGTTLTGAHVEQLIQMSQHALNPPQAADFSKESEVDASQLTTLAESHKQVTEKIMPFIAQSCGELLAKKELLDASKALLGKELGNKIERMTARDVFDALRPKVKSVYTESFATHEYGRQLKAFVDSMTFPEYTKADKLGDATRNLQIVWEMVTKKPDSDDETLQKLEQSLREEGVTEGTLPQESAMSPELTAQPPAEQPVQPAAGTSLTPTQASPEAWRVNAMTPEQSAELVEKLRQPAT